MDSGKKRMNDGVKILMPDCGEDLQADTVILQLAWRDIVCSPVYGDFVPARHQPGGKMLGEGFESSVAGWNAPRSENDDAHKPEKSTGYTALSPAQFLRKSLI
jgi:hypothetical protein